MLAYDPALPVLGLPGSVLLERAAAAGLRAVPEFFADRGYDAPADGGPATLVDRREPGALLHDPEQVADRVLHAVVDGVVTTVDGTDAAVEAASVCVHGDSPGAVAMAAAVRERLEGAGVDLAAFV